MPERGASGKTLEPNTGSVHYLLAAAAAFCCAGRHAFARGRRCDFCTRSVWLRAAARCRTPGAIVSATMSCLYQLGVGWRRCCRCRDAVVARALYRQRSRIAPTPESGRSSGRCFRRLLLRWLMTSRTMMSASVSEVSDSSSTSKRQDPGKV